MQKNQELATPSSCLNKAADDEPIFVLRANDPIAPAVVRFWAAMAEGVHEEVKRREAWKLAEQMGRWKHTQELVKESKASPVAEPQES